MDEVALHSHSRLFEYAESDKLAGRLAGELVKYMKLVSFQVVSIVYCIEQLSIPSLNPLPP